MERIDWEKSRGDAQKLEASGFGGLVQASPPELCEWASRAMHCWVWCGGWAPERWACYGALHDVPDWHLLTELQQTIRRHV